MDDLEITRKCALAMDLACYEVSNNPPEHTIRLNGSSSPANEYWPLTKDAQAMALVKKFRLDIAHCDDGAVNVFHYADGPKAEVEISDRDLNRAICECVARLPAQQPADAAGER